MAYGINNKVCGNTIEEVLVADIDGGAVNSITDGDYYYAQGQIKRTNKGVRHLF